VKAVAVSAVAVAAVVAVARVAAKAVVENVDKSLLMILWKKRSIIGRFFLYLHLENQELTK
jgi:hypothetical protein